jgi:hypothetical protein
MKINEARHINTTSSPLAFIMLFFAEVIELLMVETNQVYHHYMALQPRRQPSSYWYVHTC